MTKENKQPSALFSERVGKISIRMMLDIRNRKTMIGDDPVLPLCIRFVQDGKRLYHRLGEQYTEKELNAIKLSTGYGMQREEGKETRFQTKMRLNSIFTEYVTLVQDLSNTGLLTIDRIETALTGKSKDRSLIGIWEAMIQERLDAGKVGTANSYATALHSFIKFTHFTSKDGFAIDANVVRKWQKGMEKKAGLAGNTATGTIKWIALVFMMIDHSGKMLFPNVPEMRMLGRIAFPLYCWALVVGCEYTRSMPRYLLRILLTGVISQPLYMAALNHTWQEPSVFLTLFLAVLGLWGLREKKWGSHIWAPPAVMALAVLTHADYGWKGVLLVFLLYAARDSRRALAAVMIAYCLFWGSTSSAVSSIFGLPLKPLLSLPALGTILSPFFRLQAMALLALPLMLFPMENIRMPKILGYLLYPLHLLVLWGLEQIL